MVRAAASGIIPARAGFTPTARRSWRRWTDHPRSRGVYAPAPAVRTGRPGSSPLARGLPAATSASACRRRIIPARAGFTAPAACDTKKEGDHPRSRGVYVRSPPTSSAPGWIIPARAGFTRPRPRSRGCASDHPRSRGVYQTAIALGRHGAGSSPLARGLLGAHVGGGPPGRIIPARAGFTGGDPHRGGRRRDHPRSRGVYRRIRRSAAGPGDHPRSRGVYGRSGLSGASGRGSSPLARGLPQPEEGASGDPGIIPARAGFTPGHPYGDETTPDHPRSRGVYTTAGSPWRVRGGSSPLARGLRRASPRSWRRPRIIPARAGFTRPV